MKLGTMVHYLQKEKKSYFSTKFILLIKSKNEFERIAFLLILQN